MPEKMFDTRLLVMLAETPVHAGSGAELGAVDLPVQRERHTRYPTIHGSGVKGVLRDLSERKNGTKGITEYLFGSPPPEGPGGEALEAGTSPVSDAPPGTAERFVGPPLEAGTLAVSDARLLLLPVRSVGVAFAWTTCPYLLSRLQRDLEQTGSEKARELVAAIHETIEGVGRDKARVADKFPLDKAFIEELEVEVEKGKATKLANVLTRLLPQSDGLRYWRELLPKNLVVLPDELFADLALHCTEIVTRVRLTDEKTVAKRALWTEEYVPADSLFYCVLGLEGRRLQKKIKAKGANGEPANGWDWVRDLLRANPLAQFGGKETIGRGFLRLQLWPE